MGVGAPLGIQGLAMLTGNCVFLDIEPFLDEKERVSLRVNKQTWHGLVFLFLFFVIVQFSLVFSVGGSAFIC